MVPGNTQSNISQFYPTQTCPLPDFFQYLTFFNIRFFFQYPTFFNNRLESARYWKKNYLLGPSDISPTKLPNICSYHVLSRVSWTKGPPQPFWRRDNPKWTDPSCISTLTPWRPACQEVPLGPSVDNDDAVDDDDDGSAANEQWSNEACFTMACLGTHLPALHNLSGPSFQHLHTSMLLHCYIATYTPTRASTIADSARLSTFGPCVRQLRHLLQCIKAYMP